MSTQGPIMLVDWFIRLLNDTTVRMQTVMQTTQRVALHEINVDKPAGLNHKCDILVTLRLEKQWYFSDRPK